MNNTLKNRLQYHVTGAIERGEAQAIVEIPALHTLSPWQVSPLGNVMKNSLKIASIEPMPSNNESERIANARLISSAPDLLAICEEIANDSKCDLVNSERRIRLYSAISKAKGEA